MLRTSVCELLSVEKLRILRITIYISEVSKTMITNSSIQYLDELKILRFAQNVDNQKIIQLIVLATKDKWALRFLNIHLLEMQIASGFAFYTM